MYAKRTWAFSFTKEKLFHLLFGNMLTAYIFVMADF